MATLGEKIRNLRKQKGLSQEDFSYEIGVARQTISKWETDLMQPTTENVQAICEYFNIDINSFLDENAVPQINEKSDNKQSDTAIADSTTGAESETVGEAAKLTRKSKILLLISIISLSLIAIIGLVLGCICSRSFNSTKGDYIKVSYTKINWSGIVCFCIAIIAVVTLITVIIRLLIKKHKKQCLGDKMQTKDD